ncbi:hypothetical protein JYU15_02075 [bacterium AH-315-I18]|nr:hypothetical protein [Phycisphaeraceae bacterium]MBN4061203.1 hypothetical protein [bacterium AH-315-I18]
MTSKSPIHLLTQRVSILRSTTPLNDYGLPVLTWQTHLKNVPAKLELFDSHSSTATREHVRYKIHFPIGIDIQQMDRISIDQRLYQVLVVTNQDSANPLKTVLTTEVLP